MEQRISENREANKKHIEDLLNMPIEQQGNMGLIREEIKEFGGKFCNFYGSHYGYVIGAVADSYDYYWCYLDHKGNIRFSTCCSNPTVVEYNPFELPESFKFELLIKGVNMCPDMFFNTVKEKFKDCEDVFFTDVYIGNKKYSRTEFL